MEWANSGITLYNAIVKVKPYASAGITASINTASNQVTPSSQVLYSNDINIYSVGIISIDAEFQVLGYAQLKKISGATMVGQWSGTAFSYQRTYEAGWTAARNFYGPETTGATYTPAGVIPTFADGSEGEVRFGIRAVGSVVLNGGYSFLSVELARASITASAGLLFAHQSSSTTACGGLASSISHAQIDLFTEINASLDIIGLSPWSKPIYTQRVPLLSWGREQSIYTPSKIQETNTDVSFRLKKTGLSHPNVTSTPGDVDVSDPTKLKAYINGTEYANSIGNANGMYVFSHGQTLQPGSHTLGVWLPEEDTPLFRAAGQCVSKTIVVE